MCAYVRVNVCDVKSLALVLLNPVNTQRDSFAEDTWHMRRLDERDVSQEKKKEMIFKCTPWKYLCVFQ